MPSYNIDPELAKSLSYNDDPELDLLGGEPVTEEYTGEGLKNASLFTGDAFEETGPKVFPQRALYGRIMAQHATGFPTKVQSPKLYINTNAPFSGLVCGVQGSGKSHTTSVLLESCLISDQRLGTLPAPLSALLFHFDTAAGGGHVQPCEAAYIASLDAKRGGSATPPKVTVLVLPNTLRTMQQVYGNLPGVKVEPLHFAPIDISGERLLAMMKVDQEQHMPLYMECIMSILRSMDPFDYSEFRRQIKEQPFAPTQKAMLDLRLNLLDSCLQGGNTSNRASRHFNQGCLTIIDLSSPFMDGSSACGFFDIILGLFIEMETKVTGKLVVLDEAHKYLTSSGSSTRLTDSLLSVIRQQRHLATRVLISTQEPTVVPAKFLDLCSFVIAHRFSSPKWFDHLKQHISAVDTQWFSKVVTLRTGEAMVFAPAGVGLRHTWQAEGGLPISSRTAVAPFGQGYLFVRSRERITLDGGRSRLAAPEPSMALQSALDPIHPDNICLPITSGITLEAKLSTANAEQSECMAYSDLDTSEHVPDTPRSGNSWRLPSVVHTPGWEESSNPSISKMTMLPAWAAKSTGEDIDERPKTLSPFGTASSNVDIPRSSTTATGSVPKYFLPPVEPRFRALVKLLQQAYERGQPRMSWTEIGTELKKQHPSPYTGKLRQYLDAAVDKKLIEVGGESPQQWVQLSSRRSAPQKYAPLVAVLRELLDAGDAQPSRSQVAVQLYEKYPKAVVGKFRRYAQEAEAAGVISCDPICDTVQLVLSVL